MELKATDSKFNKKADNTPSCAKCGHLGICAIYRAIKPLMGNWDDSTRPLEAEQLASVCKLYAENFIVVRNEDAGDTNDN